MYKFIAHRGNDNHLYVENTKKAIIASLKKDYIYGVEFDIRITKDNKFVISHNATINLISDGNGFIKNKTYKDLLKYNYSYKGKKFMICELNKLLLSIHSKKIILIEIKEEDNYTNKQINKLIKTIKKYFYLNIYLCSFNYNLIKEIKNRYPKIKCGLIVGKIINRGKKYDFFDFISIPLDYYLDLKNNFPTMIWTINTLKKLNQIKENSYVITDNAYKFIND